MAASGSRRATEDSVLTGVPSGIVAWPKIAGSGSGGEDGAFLHAPGLDQGLGGKLILIGPRLVGKAVHRTLNRHVAAANPA